MAQGAQFQHYLKHIASGEGDVEGQEVLGRFQLVPDSQLEITRIPKEYPATYTQYLQGTNGQHADFLTLFEYGPWRIESRNNMEHFARLVVQFCMAISDDEMKDHDIQMLDV